MSTELKQLLSLTEAAERLNVHPATLRRWADKGDVMVMVTPGGHRRFPVSEVERLRQVDRSGSGEAVVLGQKWAQQAISHARQEVADHPQKPWITEIDDDEREQKRRMGREMVDLLRQYVMRDDDEPGLLDQARDLGRSYVVGTREGGASLSQALDATMFFRDSILESTLLFPDIARLDPDTSKRYLRRVNRFMNSILLAVAEAFED